MYIEQAQKNLSDWWRYLIGLFIVFFFWQIIGAIPFVAAIFNKVGLEGLASLQDPEKMFTILENSSLTFFYLMLMFVIGLLGLFFTTKFLHNQTLTNLTTSRAKIDWNRVIFAFFTWGILSVAMTAVDIFYFSPDEYIYNFNLNSFLILAVLAIILVPLQTSFEEYFFRGYLMQGLGNIFKNRFFPLVFTSLAFGLMHIANPEVGKLGYFIMIFYIGTGFFLGIITLMDEGLELALGFHAANNLFIALLVTADWTAFQTDSIFKATSEPTYIGWDEFVADPWVISEIAIPVFIIFPLLLFIYSKKYNWTDWNDKLTGKVKSLSVSDEDIWDKR